MIADRRDLRLRRSPWPSDCWTIKQDLKRLAGERTVTEGAARATIASLR
jgi:hypothetical protein